MVSFEVQEKAEFLIRRVASIELANRRYKVYTPFRGGLIKRREVVDATMTTLTKPTTSTTGCLPMPTSGDVEAATTHSISFSGKIELRPPLVSDGSSHVSSMESEDGSHTTTTNAVVGVVVNDHDEDDDGVFSSEDLGIPVKEWLGQVVVMASEGTATESSPITSPDNGNGNDDDNDETVKDDMYDSLTRCQDAMHQILWNADLKMRKLQYEVFMYQRMYEDAKLTNELSELRIDQLERQLKLASSTGNGKPSRCCSGQPNDDEDDNNDDPMMVITNGSSPGGGSGAGVWGDLRMANHLNKLLASRCKALDENLKLKNLLSSCCSKCRSRITQKQQDVSNLGRTTTTTTPLSTQQPATAAATTTTTTVVHRPTFQRAAHAMVQKIGQTVPLHPIERRTMAAATTTTTTSPESLSDEQQKINLSRRNKLANAKIIRRHETSEKSRDLVE